MAISLSKVESIPVNFKSSTPAVAGKRDCLLWILLVFEATLSHACRYCLVPVFFPALSEASRWGCSPAPRLSSVARWRGFISHVTTGTSLSVLLCETGIPAVTSRVSGSHSESCVSHFPHAK